MYMCTHTHSEEDQDRLGPPARTPLDDALQKAAPRSARTSSQQGEHVGQGWRRLRGWVGLQVGPAMAKQCFRHRPLHADGDQSPPPLGPGMPGASTQAGWCLTGLEGNKLSHEVRGVVAPAAVSLTS